jgi:hypothetical protein
MQAWKESLMFCWLTVLAHAGEVAVLGLEVAGARLE